MVDRIRELMEHLGQSSSQFADRIEVPRAVLSHILSGRNKPSLDVIIKILANNEKVSPDWLLHGKGEMLISVAPKPTCETEPMVPRKSISEKPSETLVSELDAEKVQINNASDTPLKNTAVSEKKLKQVILVYSDNTFSVLSPEAGIIT
ncbi:helix-turn-helix domain-containing protein [Pontibacter burrus]|uniref:Helix-turn-helix transcriptional regulator n=1 Tax=Pontibacter burrus TaxID=2704466 RepID=A0A6B3LZ49_9BACT|nr:helix-turn-helix transcriptional regulator [Pontibacter burrus]NEM98920.1 helix-turn-helix transcriptional regulator [Pontibacter burrus]